MSFTQYTKCVPIGAKKYPAWAPKPTSVLVVSSIAVLIATLIVPYLALIEIPLLISYCLWWLYDRLICLDGDVCAIGMLGVTAVLVYPLTLLGPHVATTAIIVFIVAWVGQFIGHKIEGRKPSFFDDIKFLLVGPAWLLGHVYRRVGIAY